MDDRQQIVDVLTNYATGLDARDWADLVSLMDTYRRLHRAARERGVTLWDARP